MSEREIRSVLSACPASATPAERFAGLQARLKCGTQCGSCVQELLRMSAEAVVS